MMETDTRPRQGGKRMRFGRLEINPALSPGVLDTATWDRAAAWAAIGAAEDGYWPVLAEAARSGAELPVTADLAPHAPSCVWHEDTLCCLAGLADGQQVFLAVGPGLDDAILGEPAGRKVLPERTTTTPSAIGHQQSAILALYPTDAAVIDRFFRHLAPDKGPRGAGAGAAARHRHAHDHGGVARDLAGHGEGRLRGQRHPEFRARAELPGDAARGPAGREEHRLRFRDHRDRLHRQLVRGAVGGGRARRAQARRTAPLRRRRRPHPGEARGRWAGAGQAAAGRDALLLVLHAGRIGCAGLRGVVG